jgi:hypothetical protein
MSTWTGAVSTDWNNALNWGPGGVGTGIPNATVDAIFSGAVPNLCVLGANRTCRALTFTGYTSTVNLATFTLSASNNITFQADQASRITGTTGTLTSTASATITSNTGIWPLNYSIANVGGITITLADDMRISGSYGDLLAGTRIINFNKLFVGSNVIISAITGGTTNIIMNGSGTYSGAAQGNLEIDTTGNIIITGSVRFSRRFIVTNVGSLTMTSANVSIQDTTTVDLGGRQIGNLTHVFTSTSTVTYLSNVVCNNFTIGNGTHTYNGPGRIFASGNYVLSGTSSGSLVVELIGSGTISVGTMGLACFIAATGSYTLGATLTINNTFTSAIGATLNTGSSTVTLGGITINTPNVNWNNITIVNNATLTINAQLLIASNLLLNGNTVFLGTNGFTTQNLTCTTAASTITLQNITANPLAEYRVNGVLTLIGTLANRIILQAAGSASFNGTITPVATLNYLSGVSPSIGMTVSQAGGVSPVGLIGLLPNRPVITGGVSPTFTISPSATATIGTSLAMRAGYKAKFILTNNGTSSQNVTYVATQDIDSSDGVTILVFGSNGDDINNSTIALFRTLNWGPLVAPSGSVYYTFVT